MSDDHSSTTQHQEPPKSLFGILSRIGPGLIIAGSIVGSGELIATTKTGAEAGFWLLWLILIGCVIKVFVQVELGRYAISSGETTMLAMNHLPGPRLKRRGNWVIWFWFAMFLASVAQLGGIVGGVGQALAISAPITSDARAYNQLAKLETKVIVDVAELRRHLDSEKQAPTSDSDSEEPDSDAQRESILLTLRAIDDQHTAVEFIHSYLSDLIDKELREELTSPSEDEDEESEEDEDSEEMSLADKRADVRGLLDYLQQLRARLRNVAGIETPADEDVADDFADPVDTGPPGVAGPGAPANRPSEEDADKARLERDQAWVDENLTGLQEQLVRLYELEDISSEIRALRRDLEALDEEAKEEDRQAIESKITELVKQEDDLVFAAYDADKEIGTDDGILLTDCFMTYKSETDWEPPIDDKIWAAIVAIITSIILLYGRFGLIQSFSTAMVACFTVITIVNLFLLNFNPSWAVSISDIMNGMSFRLPPGDGGSGALSTALRAFGIIGVGAAELIAYPYWCLEKGYARFTGPRDDSQAWVDRAKGWLRVMRVDAWGSMIIYTFATVAFYLLGACVLGRVGLNPESHNLVRYLSVMYEPVFGKTTEILFLFGCFAVLYSTFFVANAGNARMFSDSLRVMGLIPVTEKSYSRSVRFFSGLFPIVCLVIYIYVPRPAYLVLLSGLMQAIMLPMLAATALYLRYTRIDKRLAPSIIWDLFLWVSSIGMLVAGCWAGWTELQKLF